ncbi:hypothetical protein C8J56DRAFT_859543 [Mycena floridula]|nr:hypothetical protein C8J56DRAFT_859543 [Mycena floridula]
MVEKKSCGLSWTSNRRAVGTTDSISRAAIDELLVSNRAPSHIQESQIRESLAECLQSLRELDDQIPAAISGDRQQELLDEQALKRREAQEYRTILHPIRRLPAEILSEIFLDIIDEDLENLAGFQNDRFMSSLDPSAMHWVLSLVSAYWRSVIITFPRLWSTIRLTPRILGTELQPFLDGEVETNAGEDREEEKASAEEKSVAGETSEKVEIDEREKRKSLDLDYYSQLQWTSSRLSIQLERSASCQLRVSVVIFKPKMNLEQHSVLQMILPTSSRWTALLLLTTTIPTTFLSSLKGSLPSLSVLHVLIPAWPEALPDFAESVPMLTTLAGHPRFLTQFKVPFSQITHYSTSSLMDYDCCQLISLFQKLPNLETLDILCEQEEYRDHQDDVVDPFRLLFLRKLVSKRNLDSLHHSSDDCSILLLLTCPALQDLDIGLYESTKQLQLFLHRSQCSLRTLSLELHDVPDEDCIQLLRETPSIVSLTLSCTEALVNKLLDTFINDNSVTPALQSLTILIDGEFDSEQLRQLQVLRPLLKKVELKVEFARKISRTF